MDYKYIEQLLERYWSLFDCGLQEETLGDDFDARILDSIGEDEKEPKAKVVSWSSRLMPLFKAAAVVAILLTIGNAAQAPWNYGWDNPQDEYAKYRQQQVDTVNILSPVQAENVTDTVAAPKSEESSYIE